MKCIEQDAKQMLDAMGVATPRRIFFDAHSAITTDGEWLSWSDVVVKAQVLQGRRGQRGWVVKTTPDRAMDVRTTIQQSLGETPNAGFLFEEVVPHSSEWYVSCDIDRTAGSLRVNVSEQGGMSVADATSWGVATAADVDALSIPSAIRDVLRKIVDQMSSRDLSSVEINPLAVRDDGSCVALDAKIELDDAAAFRHPEWATLHRLPELGRALTERERAYESFLSRAGHRGTFGRYIELDGDIAMVLSGGGASLVALDALLAAGGRPANYCEMSGNPDPEMMREAVGILLSKPGIRGVWVAGSFANFTDIQATIHAVLEAVTVSGLNVPICIRRDGPHADEAMAEAESWAAMNHRTVRFDRGDTTLDDSARGLMQLLKTV